MSDYAQIINAARALVENFDAHEAERGPCNFQFVNPASGKLEDNHLMMPVPLLGQLRTAVRELQTEQADPSAAKRRAKAFEDALIALVEKNPTDALVVVTGAFVSLVLHLLRSKGHKPEGDIKIDGGENRDITIHAEKKGVNRA